MRRRDEGEHGRRTVEAPSSETPGSSAGRRHRRRLPRLLLVAVGGGLAGAVSFMVLWIAFPYDFDRLDDYPAATRVIDRDGRVLRVYVSSTDEMRLPVALEEISPWLRLATVAVEDRRFYRHPGIDPFAIARAFLQNAVRLRIHSGASTITMQLVRMTEPRPRTLRAKAIEAFRALQITARRGKDETLEAYLNLAPYGGNVRGAEAAALRFFAKSARELTLGEAALLAGLPQSPSRLRPDRHYERALARRGTVLRAMLREAMIDEPQYRRALASRPEVRRHPWPFEAPHAADLARRVARRRPRGGGGTIATTLDRQAQRSARSHLRVFLAADGRRGLAAAAVVIEVQTGSVRALVGSTDFFDEERAGQVNAATARRSPGSTLKPFLYALAFDLGTAGPSTFLADVPGAWPGYAPENFDRRFHGPVAAGEALARSLNLPALRLQSAVGGGAFLDLLRALGLRSLERRSEHYGLALAVGGGEVRLLELAAAYATLVRGGVHRPWRLLRSELATSSKPVRDRVLSEAACGLVLRALSRDEHLRRATGRSPLPAEPRVGYKTGTSRGLRDAWALAFTPHHVAAVWIGDPRGASHPDLIGLDAAAPVALSILEEVGGADPPRWKEPEGVVELPACAATGFPRGSACPAILSARFTAAAAARLPSCTVHRRVFVSPRTGRRLCPSCRPHLTEGTAGREVLVEDWPPPVARWLARRRRLRAPPAHAPSCGRAASGAPPRILSPADGAEYGWIEGAPSAQEVTLAAATSRNASRLHWFVDGDLVGSAAPGARIAWPLEPGRHEVRCVDDRGRAASATIRCARLR